MGKAVVLHSGGINSTVMLAAAWADYQLSLLHVEIGSPGSAAERRVFEQHARAAEAERMLITELPHVAAVGQFAQPRKPETHNGPESPPPALAATGLISTMLDVAVYWCEAIGARHVLLGVSEDMGVSRDSNHTCHPDYRREFFQLYNEMLEVGSRARVPVRVETPLIDLTRPEVIKLGERLGAPFENTWSCTRCPDSPCGGCDACIRRANGFLSAGVLDPLAGGVQPTRP